MADTNHGQPRNGKPITDELNGTSWRTPTNASTSTRSFDAVAAVHQQGPPAGDVDSVRLEVRSYGLCRWVKDSFRVGAIEMMRSERSATSAPTSFGRVVRCGLRPSK